MNWGHRASDTREYWVRKWQQHIQRVDRSSFDAAGQDIYEYLRNKVNWVVQTVDDVGVAGEEFKYCSVYVRGLVWSRLSLDRLDEDPDLIRFYKEQLYPCLQIQPGEDWRPVILAPTAQSVVAVYCQWLAWSGKIP